MVFLMDRLIQKEDFVSRGYKVETPMKRDKGKSCESGAVVRQSG